MKRVLCIVGSMNAGGAETFLMKMYRNIDRNEYQMDFCVSADEKGVYDDEIIAMGGRVIHTVPKSNGLYKSFVSIKNIVRDNGYKNVLRVSQHSLSALELLAARIGGAKNVVYRSSNSQTGGGKVNRILHKIFMFLPMYVPTKRIAPSTEAAEFMFGKRLTKHGKVKILHNALAVENYIYNTAAHENIRKELNLGDSFVIGHVGRFSAQKNHKRLIEIFKYISDRLPNAKLVLVGKGELQADVEAQAEKLGLKEKVVFTGVRKDVPELLMGMDVLLFPSFFEGMPNVVIEAQATGLPCVISDSITREADITGTVQYVSLNESDSVWAEKVLEIADSGMERHDMTECFKKNRYDIESVTEDFVKLIFD